MDRAKLEVDEVFCAAVELVSPAERAAYLDQVCGDDFETRRRVERLLEAQSQAGSFLAACPAVAAATTDSLAERPGTVIGPYKLLQQIGEGGFGTVYMAEQTQPVQRKVALKVIKAGMDSSQIIARFEAERQALAVMDHVNIARVFDGGTTGGEPGGVSPGRPYFVMELVHGVPITKYCDDNHLTPRERLELFVPVCQAIQHAHQKGIIHRDIKPSNVMVTLYDGKPVPKVIDFGVAKATEQKLTERTLFTQYGTMVGTLEYMSPEQAEMSALGVDTRSDIFSLGVLLYELLTGSTPLSHKRMKEAAYTEILRMIKEEEPPKPSTRLSDSGEALASISAQRHMEPAKLTKLVRGELDWIVMKTLEKDRNRRYETANGFAADVQRYLNDEAVQACPPSVTYKLRKFVRRNKRALTMASVVVLAVFLLVGSIGWMVRDRAAREQESARDRAARQLVVEEIVKQGLEEADKWQKEQRWPEALAAVKRAESALAAGDSTEFQRRVQERKSDLEMVQRLEDIRTQVMSVVIDERVFSVEQADRDYSRAFAHYGVDVESLTVERAAELIRARSVAVQLAAALDGWAMARRKARKDDTGWKQLLAVARATDPEPWRDQFRQAWERTDKEALAKLAASDKILTLPAQTLYLLGSALRQIDAKTEAEKLLRQAQQLYPDDFWINYELAFCCVWKNPRRDVDGAIRYLTAAIAIRKQSTEPYRTIAPLLVDKGDLDEAIAANKEALRLKPDHWVVHHNLGIALSAKGQLDEAIASWRESIRINPKWSWPHSALGDALALKGELDEAIASCSRAIELDPNSANAHIALGNVLVKLGKLDEAIAEYRKAIELDPNSANAHIALGNVLVKQGKLDEAIAEHRKAIELDPKNAYAHSGIGIVLAKQKKLDTAIAEYHKAIELDPNNSAAHNNLGNALKSQGKRDEAMAEYRKAIEIDPKCAPAHNNLGIALKSQGKLDEAIVCSKKAIELDPHYAPAHGSLGLALYDQKKLDEAIVEYRKAIELDPQFAWVHTNLGNALRDQGKLDEAIAEYRKAIELDPKNAPAHNELAWMLATCPDGKFRNAALAVELGNKAVELAPKEGNYWNTLGVAHYRAGDWKAAIETLKKSDELQKDNFFSFNAFFLAMAHWQLSDRPDARTWYDKAVEWMEKNDPKNEELRRFRAEAEELMKIERKKD